MTTTYRKKILQIPEYGEYFQNCSILANITIDDIHYACELISKKLDFYPLFVTLYKLLSDNCNTERMYVHNRYSILYHAELHALVTFLATIEGCIHSPTLEDKDIPALAIAALMHDYNHSHGKYSDEYNIQRAVSGVKHQVDREDVDIIINAIKATQFPWNSKQPNIEGRILRDADLMMAYVKCRSIRSELEQGLKDEMFPQLTYNEYKTKQSQFHLTFQWNTTWGRNKAIRFNYPALLMN